MRKAFMWIIVLVGLLICFGGSLLLYFTVTAYKPESQLYISNLSDKPKPELSLPTDLKLLTWNIGYGGLGTKADFIMEGGKMGVPEGHDDVERNLRAIESVLKDSVADIYLLQEVERASSRTFDINELNRITTRFPDYFSWFAPNFKVQYVPSPISDPIGRVDSGILTLGRWDTPATIRYQLPGEFPWPTRIFHLKRCLTLARFKSPVENRDWCVINLHLSAYDKGATLRKQQLKFVKNLMLQLYDQGHYVVLGGDWNTMLPGIAMDTFGAYTTSKKSLFWLAYLPENWTPKEWQWGFDKGVPTCRTLEQPYVQNQNFTTIIDGFLISPNVDLIEVKGLDLGFENSDHNPVMARVRLKE